MKLHRYNNFIINESSDNIISNIMNSVEHMNPSVQSVFEYIDDITVEYQDSSIHVKVMLGVYGNITEQEDDGDMDEREFFDICNVRDGQINYHLQYPINMLEDIHSMRNEICYYISIQGKSNSLKDIMEKILKRLTLKYDVDVIDSNLFFSVIYLENKK